jgi:hypothetical protein
MSSISKTLFACAFMCSFETLPWSAYAGEKAAPPEPRTALEAFLSDTGRIIIKEFHSIGNLEGTLGTKMEGSSSLLVSWSGVGAYRGIIGDYDR